MLEEKGNATGTGTEIKKTQFWWKIFRVAKKTNKMRD